MAARDEPHRLAPDIYVFEKTLLELRSYLLPDRLKTLARHLLTETEVQSACAENIEPDERAIKVLTTWNDWKGPRVRDLVREMVLWTQGQCLEKRVWSEFAARRIHPSLIPEDLETLLAQDPPDSLAIPPEPAPQPTQPAIAYNILQQNFYAPGQTPGFGERNNAAITDGGTGNTIPPAVGYHQNQGPPLPPGNPVTTAPGGQWPVAIGPSYNQFIAAATASQFSAQPAATTTVPPSGQFDLPGRPTEWEVVQASAPSSGQFHATTTAPHTGPATSVKLEPTTTPPSGQHGPTFTPPVVPFSSFTAPPVGKSPTAQFSPNGQTTQARLVLNRGVASTDPLKQKTLAFQERLFDSLQRQWKKSITLDWLPGGKSFSLQEYYVGLRWKKRVQRLIQNRQEKLESVYEILKIANERPRATNILIEAPPGMGKTCSMAKLALDWDPQSGDSDNPVNQFHYVFLLKLSDVDEQSSLPELIVKQHHQLEDDDKEFIKSILRGQTNQRVLLLLDGYDEYTLGTNAEIDKAIEHSIGKCFLILTSRPGSDSGNKKYIYVSENIRKKLDGEIIIEGFDDDSIKGASIKYLESEENSAAMLKQAEEAGIYELLKVPIILLFVCLIYSEEEGLPRTRTKIYSEVFAKTMERGVMKRETLRREELDSLLVGLGELAWKAIKKNVKQLLLRKDEVEKKHPDILKLGLLFEVGVERVSRNPQPTYVSFQHKSLQEFAAAKYITHRLQQAEDEDKERKMKKLSSSSTKSTVKEFFPHPNSINLQKEVVAFCAGLLEDPRPLLEHVSDLSVSNGIINPIILKSISRESQTMSLSRDVVLRILKHRHNLTIVGSTTGLLTEVIPKDDAPLHSLERLNLTRAELNNLDIKHFGSLIRDKKLPALRDLDLSRNSLSGSLPELLPLCDGIQSLKELYLSNTGLNETDVQHLAVIVQDIKIESINLAGNTLTGLLSEFKLCSQAKNLRRLTLHSASLSRSNVQYLGGLIRDNKLPALRELYLSHNSLSGSLPELLPLCDGIQSLKELYLGDTGLNETDVQHLAVIVQDTKIEYIDLAGNTLTGLLAKFEFCSKAKTIRYLTLSETKLNKTDVRYLAGLIRDTKLSKMVLEYNNLGDIEDECGELIKAYAAHAQWQSPILLLDLRLNRFSHEFKTKWQQHTEGIKWFTVKF